MDFPSFMIHTSFFPSALVLIYFFPFKRAFDDLLVLRAIFSFLNWNGQRVYSRRVETLFGDIGKSRERERERAIHSVT